VKQWDCDFYTVSGHKMLGPTGVGVLFGKKSLLEDMPPYQGGGDMIETVSTDGFTVAELPSKFEAGTPNIAGVIGLGAAIDYFATHNRASLVEHERQLGLMLLEALQARRNIRLFTDGGDDWTGIVTFLHESIHPHDMAAIAGAGGVCIRAGHHCAQPLMRSLGSTSTSRVSPFFYNTTNDIERFLAALDQAEALFG